MFRRRGGIVGILLSSFASGVSRCGLVFPRHVRHCANELNAFEMNLKEKSRQTGANRFSFVDATMTKESVGERPKNRRNDSEMVLTTQTERMDGHEEEKKDVLLSVGCP